MTVLITGASGGIGEEIARSFAKFGYNVAINYYKSESHAKILEKELREVGCNVKAYLADVSDSLQVNKMVSSIETDLGYIDVLINNAGVSLQKLLTDMTDEDYNFIMDVNMRGTFNCCRAVLPSMVHNKNGSIINVSSMWGQVGASCEALYSASKSAVIGLTKALAKETGPSNIRVNCIAPGVIDTKMNAMHSEETMNELIDETPLMRIGTPKDIADTALFLASDAASFITGQVFGVNGGMII